MRWRNGSRTSIPVDLKGTDEPRIEGKTAQLTVPTAYALVHLPGTRAAALQPSIRVRFRNLEWRTAAGS
jgi:hypothetical protein